MNVTATTFPRRSRRDMRAPSCVVSVKSGAGPILDRRASGFGAWPNPGAGQAPSPMRRLAITDARVGPFRLRLPGACAGVRPRAHPSLAFQLFPELVEKPPVGAVGNQLLWAALHHPGFPQAKRVEAHGLLRVVRSPAAERDLRHRLAGVLWRALEALVRKCPRAAARLHGAQLIALEDGAEGSLGRHGVSLDELAVGRDQAAEVLGPGAVECAVDQDPPDLPGPQLLRVGRKPEKAVDLALRQKPLGLGRRMLQPRDVPIGIEPDLGDDAGDERVLGG